MKQVFIKSGSAVADNVPALLLDENGVLVEVAYSLISTGAEMEVWYRHDGAQWVQDIIRSIG